MSDWTKSKWWYFTLAAIGLLCGIIGYRFLGPKPTVHRAVWQIPTSKHHLPKEYQRLREERERYYAKVGRPDNDMDETGGLEP